MSEAVVNNVYTVNDIRDNWMTLIVDVAIVVLVLLMLWCVYVDVRYYFSKTDSSASKSESAVSSKPESKMSRITSGSHVILLSCVAVVCAVAIIAYCLIGFLPKDEFNVAKVETAYSITDLQSANTNRGLTDKLNDQRDINQSIDVSFVDKHGVPHDGTLSVINNTAKLLVGTVSGSQEYKAR